MEQFHIECGSNGTIKIDKVDAIRTCVEVYNREGIYEFVDLFIDDLGGDRVSYTQILTIRTWDDKRRIKRERTEDISWWYLKGVLTSHFRTIHK
jgi:hypothetical protein